jgi:inner membrane protein
MRSEYWVVAALILTIAEVLAPGTFLIFFAGGALVTAAAQLLVLPVTAQLAIFSVATIVLLLAGNSLYRRLLAKKRENTLGLGPIGEPGIVEQRIVNGRGKVRVRDTSWLATGPDLAKGTAIVVVQRDGTLLQVAPLHDAPSAEHANS